MIKRIKQIITAFVWKLAVERRLKYSKPHLVYNPLLSYPRNQRCFCNSGKKFKACCINKLPSKCLPVQAAEAYDLIKLIEAQRNEA